MEASVALSITASLALGSRWVNAGWVLMLLSAHFRQIVYRGDQQFKLRLIRARRHLSVQLDSKLRQHAAPASPTFLFGTDERLSCLLNSRRGKTVRALELIEVGVNQRKTWRPNEFLLFLRVEVRQAHRLCRIDLVFSEEATRHQFENIQTTRDLGADDDAVVPVGRP